MTLVGKAENYRDEKEGLPVSGVKFNQRSKIVVHDFCFSGNVCQKSTKQEQDLFDHIKNRLQFERNII